MGAIKFIFLTAILLLTVDTNRRVRSIAILSQKNLELMEETNVELDELQAAVEENTSLDQSAITLIEGLADKIDAAGADKTKLAALTANLRASGSALAAAIAANTPAPAPADPVTDTNPNAEV
jgi:hypothetical protein